MTIKSLFILSCISLPLAYSQFNGRFDTNVYMSNLYKQDHQIEDARSQSKVIQNHMAEPILSSAHWINREVSSVVSFER